jgi:hypothetical protein
MSYVWDVMKECAATFQNMMEEVGERDNDESLDQYDWENHVYRSDRYRRAHVEVVDKTETHGIYILHSTVFAHTDDSAPIWGFDAVCGKNKITGAFHDFSLVNDDHEMWQWFNNEVKDIEWNKVRELPEWSQNIFSPAMVAAGNISDQRELGNLVDLGVKTLDYYLKNVGNRQAGADYSDRQNYYCQNQKQNPHVYRSMIAMGVEEPVINKFVDEVLFPEIDK